MSTDTIKPDDYARLHYAYHEDTDLAIVADQLEEEHGAAGSYLVWLYWPRMIAAAKAAKCFGWFSCTPQQLARTIGDVQDAGGWTIRARMWTLLHERDLIRIRQEDGITSPSAKLDVLLVEWEKWQANTALERQRLKRERARVTAGHPVHWTSRHLDEFAFTPITLRDGVTPDPARVTPDPLGVTPNRGPVTTQDKTRRNETRRDETIIKNAGAQAPLDDELPASPRTTGARIRRAQHDLGLCVSSITHMIGLANGARDTIMDPEAELKWYWKPACQLLADYGPDRLRQALTIGAGKRAVRMGYIQTILANIEQSEAMATADDPDLGRSDWAGFEGRRAGAAGEVA